MPMRHLRASCVGWACVCQPACTTVATPLRTPVKILHVFDHTLPLHSGYTFRSMAILRAQRARGWETVHLSSPRHAESSNSDEASQNVDGYTFWRTPRPTGLLTRTPAWPLAEMAATTRRLYALARQERPDVLHAHSPSLNALPAIRVARRLGIPAVYEVRAFWEDAAADHGTAAEGSLRYRLTRWLETRALRRADHVTTICNGLRNEMIGRGIAAARVTVVPNAVDVERFSPITAPNPKLQAELGLADNWVLGFCGSFYAYEGLDLAIRALPTILARIPQVKLLLVGGGPEEAALRALAAELDLGAQVVFTGRVPNAVIDDYYSLMNLLVLPRKRMRLTELVTPLKPLEAMAQGLPVLASDVGGHQELVVHGETGMLFAAEDAQALADGVFAVHENPVLVEHIKRQGRSFVSAERTWTRSVGYYESVYAAALARARA